MKKAKQKREEAKAEPKPRERGWGRVVTIGSVQQERPHPAMLVYAGTKAAQLNWTLSLARQFGGAGVTVNNLAPGAILTARNKVQMQTVAYCAYNEKLRAHKIVPELSSWKQKQTSGSWGTVLRTPSGVVQMIGV